MNSQVAKAKKNRQKCYCSIWIFNYIHERHVGYHNIIDGATVDGETDIPRNLISNKYLEVFGEEVREYVVNIAQTSAETRRWCKMIIKIEQFDQLQLL